MMLVQDVVRRHELDGPSDQRGRAEDADGQLVGNPVAEAQRRKREVVQAEQLPAAAWARKRGIVREAMREVDVESMLVDGAAGGQAEEHVVAGFIDVAGGTRGFLRQPRGRAGGAAVLRERSDIGGETVDLRVA